MMPRLSKLVIERLKAKPHVSGAPVGPAGIHQGIDHPDANLLSAFAERSLTERERAHVFNHLSQCADCREIIARAVGSEPAVIQPAVVPARRRWSAWSTLRWAALAAALGAGAIVVALHPAGERKQESISNEGHPTIVADANKSAQPPGAEAPTPELRPGAALAKSEARSAAGRLRLRTEAMPRGVSVDAHSLSAQKERGGIQQQVTGLASVRPPSPLPNGPGAGGEQQASKRAAGLVGGAMSAAPPPAGLPSPPTATREEEANVELGKAAQPDRAAETVLGRSVTAKKDASPEGGVTATGATAALPRTAQVRPGSQMAALSRKSSRQEPMSKQGPASAQWSISASGEVQRSEDSGKTWEDVKVADGVTFRVITDVDRDLWAGGSAGALYHSSDGGVIWNRVAVTSEGNPVTEAIVGIQAPSPLRVVVALASGQQWITDDGGQRWRIKP